MSAVRYEVVPVARLRTPFATKFGVPRQSGLLPEAEGLVEFLPRFSAGEFLRGLEGFSHVWLITWFHQNEGWTGASTVRPPRLGGNARVGVFASRSPNRPNPVGLSLVRIVELDTKEALLRVAGVDAVDGTPVLDIKPYLPWAESVPDARGAWAGEPPRGAKPVFISEPLEWAVRQGREDADRFLALVRQVIALEPEPAYQDEPGRIYGMILSGWSVRWTRTPEGASVVELERLRSPGA